MITNNLYGAINGSLPSGIENGIKYLYFFQVLYRSWKSCKCKSWNWYSACSDSTLNVHMHTHEAFDYVLYVSTWDQQRRQWQISSVTWEQVRGLIFCCLCQDTEMQTGVLLRIQQGPCPFHWHLENECTKHVRNVRNAHYKNQTTTFLNHKAFSRFVTKTCTRH